MGVSALLDAIGSSATVFLDTMVFAYHLGDHPRYRPLTRPVLGATEAGALRALTTTVCVAEVLVPAARSGDRDLFAAYYLFLRNFPNLTILPIDIDMAREAATVRGQTGLRMPDALHVAAAQRASADIILTNDRAWSRIASPRVLLLDNYAPLPSGTEDGI